MFSEFAALNGDEQGHGHPANSRPDSTAHSRHKHASVRVLRLVRHVKQRHQPKQPEREQQLAKHDQQPQRFKHEHGRVGTSPQQCRGCESSSSTLRVSYNVYRGRSGQHEQSAHIELGRSRLHSIERHLSWLQHERSTGRQHSWHKPVERSASAGRGLHEHDQDAGLLLHGRVAVQVWRDRRGQSVRDGGGVRVACGPVESDAHHTGRRVAQVLAAYQGRDVQVGHESARQLAQDKFE